MSVFSPDDLALLQGPPAGRRDFLDGCLVTGDLRMEALVGEVERILRHRAALLRNRAARSVDHRDLRTGSKDTSGDARGDIDSTFDVWDERLGSVRDPPRRGA